jgi:hypothetical protein
MTQVASKDFFISYNQADRTWAEWITWQLEAEGYSTILQAWDFRPGSNFILEMDAAARQATRTIAVLSPDYFTSQFTPLRMGSRDCSCLCAYGSVHPTECLPPLSILTSLDWTH